MVGAVQDRHPIYLATVCLERNRWGSRQPSFRVSNWLDRFAADGFDGIELWENHYLRADAAEQARLDGQVAIFNTYAGFTDAAADVAHREQAAAAIARTGAGGVKYNLGGDAARLAEYRRNLLAWAAQLPASCRLLCECHPGTVLESVDAARRFLAELDPVRFGVIAHVRGDCAGLENWLATFGPRLQHLHLQLRELPVTGAEVLRARGFAGSAAVEFTRGIGREEQIEALYANARADLAWYRGIWS